VNSVHILTNCFFRPPFLIASYPLTPRAMPWLGLLVAGLSLWTQRRSQGILRVCGIYGEQSGTRTCFTPSTSVSLASIIPFKFRCYIYFLLTLCNSNSELLPTARSPSKYSEQNVCVIFIFFMILYVPLISS
jgi:hypothetical protein